MENLLEFDDKDRGPRERPAAAGPRDSPGGNQVYLFYADKCELSDLIFQIYICLKWTNVALH